MARFARIVIPDVPHHVTQRGNRRLPVFFSDDDRADYLALVAQAAKANGTKLSILSPEFAPPVWLSERKTGHGQARRVMRKGAAHGSTR